MLSGATPGGSFAKGTAPALPTLSGSGQGGGPGASVASQSAGTGQRTRPLRVRGSGEGCLPSRRRGRPAWLGGAQASALRVGLPPGTDDSPQDPRVHCCLLAFDPEHPLCAESDGEAPAQGEGHTQVGGHLWRRDGGAGGHGGGTGQTYSSSRLWLSSWEGGIRQQQNVMTRLPKRSSPAGQMGVSPGPGLTPEAAVSPHALWLSPKTASVQPTRAKRRRRPG